MKTARVVGVLLGLVILAATFLLPFTDLVPGTSGQETLYGAFNFFLHNESTLAASKDSGVLILTFVYLIAFVFVVLAGAAGVVPLGAGALGAAGMGAITVAPFFAFTDYSFSAGDYGLGFAVIWAATLGCLAVAAANWRGERRARGAQAAEQAQPGQPA